MPGLPSQYIDIATQIDLAGSIASESGYIDVLAVSVLPSHVGTDVSPYQDAVENCCCQYAGRSDTSTAGRCTTGVSDAG